MTFDDFQHRAYEFAIYPEAHRVTYPLLGLFGEVAEAAEKFLKLVDLPPGFTLTLQLRDLVRVCGEAGKLAKHLRDQGSFPNPEEDGWVAEVIGESIRANPDGWREFAKEVSDAAWMIAALFTDTQASWGDHANRLLDKLTDRKFRGVIKGSGDSR